MPMPSRSSLPSQSPALQQEEDAGLEALAEELLLQSLEQ